VGFFKGDSTGDDDRVVDALVKLRKRLVREITTSRIASIPKLVWKMTSTYQCLVRRTIEEADGMRSAWNEGNLLTTVTMARSLFETGAMVRHLTDSIQKATNDKSVDALDNAIMTVGFGDRLGWLEDKGYQALNVLTVIDKMDRSVFHDKQPRFRKTYDFLSEFVHPNHLGILGLYCDQYPKEYRIEFGVTVEKKKRMLPHLRIASAMIWLVEIAASDVDKLTPAITEFVPK
jgi:hypothetical protein